MIGDDDERNEGTSPLFAGLLGALLDESLEVAPQVKHLRKRRGLGAVCGAYDGQINVMPIGITCAVCKASMAKATRPRRVKRARSA